MPFPDPRNNLGTPVTQAEADEALRKRREQIAGPEFGQGFNAYHAGNDRAAYRDQRYEADMRAGPDTAYAADQRAALGQLRDAAMGKGTMAADVAAQQQNSQMAQQLASVAAGTRGGPGAQALAARAQAYGTAQGSSQIAQEQAIARAREQAAYRQLYAQTAGSYAGQDLDTQMRQRQINAGREGMYLGAETDMRHLMWDDERGNQQFNANERERSVARKDKYIGMAVNGMSSMFGAGMMSDEHVKEDVQPSGGRRGGGSAGNALMQDNDPGLGSNPWQSPGRTRVNSETRDWERALEVAEEGSGTADEKRRIYTTAIDEQNALRAKDPIDTHITETRKPLTEAQLAEEHSRMYPEWVDAQETPGSGRYKLLSDTRAKENRVRAEGAAAMLATVAASANRGAEVVTGRRAAPVQVAPADRRLGDVALQGVSPIGAAVMPATRAVTAELRPQATGMAAPTQGASKAAQGPTTPMYQRLPPPPEEPTAQMSPEAYYGIVGTQALTGVPSLMVSDERAKEAERVAAQATAERDRIISQLRGGDAGAARAAGAQTVAQLQPKPEDERYRHGSPVDALLATLAKSSSTYEYKRPEDQPVSTPRPKEQKFAGVMAQDLERVPQLGGALVTDTPRGKQVEQGAALSALLAAVGRQQQQLQAIQEDPRYRHTSPGRK